MELVWAWGKRLMTIGPGGAAYGLGNTNGGRFTTFGGGLPIVNARGEIVGGIGRSHLHSKSLEKAFA